MVMLRLDLGSNVWIFGGIDNKILKMVKIELIEPRTVSIPIKKQDGKYAPSCAKHETFTEAL